MLWLGNQASFEAVATAKIKLQGMMAKSGSRMNDIEVPSLYSREGNTGIISIQGSLIQGDAGWMQIFGVTGYDNISAAVLEGLADKGAKKLIYHIASPGGQVNGLRPTAELLHNAAQVKSSTVYSSDMIASAAYWLGSAAGDITLDEIGTAGSLGTLYIHTDLTEMYAKEGIKKTILRAGKYKAMLNPYETPTEEALAEKQTELDYIRDMFVSAVAEYRGGTGESVNNSMGEGRVFMGTKALQVGLVDRIGSFEDAMAQSNAQAATFKPVKAAKV